MIPGPRRTAIRARRPLALLLIAGLAAAGAGCGSAGRGSTTSGPGRIPPGGGHGVPPRDSFRGQIRSATGAYSGHTGRVVIYLHPTGKGPRRSVTVTFIGSSCPGGTSCLELSGAVTGTLASATGHIPDVGHSYSLSGSGTVHPIGRAMIRGVVTGTGFIQHGQETLTLTVTGGSGSVTLAALSAPVGGFRSP